MSTVQDILPSWVIRQRPGNGLLRSLSEPQRKKLLNFLEAPCGPLRFCLAVTAGQSWLGERVTNHEEHLADFSNFIGEVEPDLARYFSNRSGGDRHNLADAVHTTCAGRRLFFDTGGELGLVPVASRPGDWVCVLFGGNIPFVLRPTGGAYRLVGECYLRDNISELAEDLWRERILSDEVFELW